MFPIYQVIFYIFAVTLVSAAVMVVVSRNPVRAALFLVLAFFASSVLWLMIQSEFLALVLIFVYVGAVMTLFLFVVMMINIDLSEVREGFVRFLPYGAVVLALLIGMMILAIGPKNLLHMSVIPIHHPAGYSNTKAMGTLLFTQYIYPFELAAVILLVAIVSAIALAFHGRKPDTKAQNIDQQHAVNKQQRLRIVKMKAEKNGSTE